MVTSEHRQHIPRPVWMSARARNAMRRPVFIGAVGVGTFVTALVAMVVMPQSTERAAQAVAPKASEWPDTAALISVVDTARVHLARADSALAISRQRALLIAQAPPDTVDSALQARRDSLDASIAALSRLLTRADNAPLPASYRAIAEAPALAGDPRVKALLDSLAEIDKERESVGALGGADPTFVALTTRATEIGREIQTIGATRRDDMQRTLATLTPATPPASGAQMAAADTLTHTAQRDTALAAYSVATAQLARARQKAVVLQQRADRAREIATTSAPPLALLAAALVVGIVLGFGVALAAEIRRPRIADEHETEWAAGARVLASVRPQPPAPERARRSADRAAPPYIDPASDAYQLVYLAVATAGANLLMLTVTGSEPAINAIVAVNFAAIAAEEARNVLVIDTDVATSSVASALRLHADPGLVEVLDGRAEWPEATVQATVGRDRTIDVVPSGTGQPLPAAGEITALLRRDITRLARHYDAIIVVAPIDLATEGLPGALPIGDAVYCARLGYTRVNALRRGMVGLRQAGGNPVGVVLWDAEPPVLLTPEELAAGPRPWRTSEMPVAGATR